MGQEPKVEILVVDDDEFYRRGVSLYLEGEGLAVLQASDAGAAWQVLEEHRPDAVVLDIVLPPGPGQAAEPRQSEGVRLAERIKARYPYLGVVIFSGREDRGGPVRTLLRSGARGIAYKLKGCPPAELLHAITAVRAGQVLIDLGVTIPPSPADGLLSTLDPLERYWVERAVAGLPCLTAREREVVALMTASHNTAGIARSLHITAKTVEKHISRIYGKLGLDALIREAPHLRRRTILGKAHQVEEVRSAQSEQS